MNKNDILYFKKIERIQNSSVFCLKQNTKQKNQKLFELNFSFFKKVQSPYLKVFKTLFSFQKFAFLREKKKEQSKIFQNEKKKYFFLSSFFEKNLKKKRIQLFLFLFCTQIFTFLFKKNDKLSSLFFGFCLISQKIFLDIFPNKIFDFFLSFFDTNTSIFHYRKLQNSFFQKTNRNADFILNGFSNFNGKFQNYFSLFFLKIQFFQKSFKIFLFQFLYELQFSFLFKLNNFFIFRKLNFFPSNFFSLNESFSSLKSERNEENFKKIQKKFFDFCFDTFMLETKFFQLFFLSTQLIPIFQKRKQKKKMILSFKFEEGFGFFSSRIGTTEIIAFQKYRIQLSAIIFQNLINICLNYFASPISLRKKCDILYTWKNRELIFSHLAKSTFFLLSTQVEKNSIHKFFQTFHLKFGENSSLLMKRRTFFENTNENSKNFFNTVFISTLSLFPSGKTNSLLFTFFENLLEKTTLDISQEFHSLKLQKDFVKKFNPQKTLTNSHFFFSQKFVKKFFLQPIVFLSKNYFPIFLTSQLNFLSFFEKPACQLNRFFSLYFFKKIWKGKRKRFFSPKGGEKNFFLSKEKFFSSSHFVEKRVKFFKNFWFLSKKFQWGGTKLPLIRLFSISPFFSTFFTAYSKNFEELLPQKFLSIFLSTKNFQSSETHFARVTFEGFCFQNEVHFQKKLKKMFFFQQQPTSERITLHLKKCKDIIKKGNGQKQVEFMTKLQKEIKNWSKLAKTNSTKRIFQYCDLIVLKFLWNWARKTHPNKSKMWIQKKYFHYIHSKKWFFGKKIGRFFVCLPLHEQS